MSLSDAWKRTLLYLSPFLLFFGGSHAARINANYMEMTSPTIEQRRFVEDFGFPLVGERYASRNLPIRFVREIVAREQAELPFNLHSIERVPDESEYLHLPVEDMIFVAVGFNQYQGCFYPGGRIRVSPSACGRTLTHEIKHAKTFQIIKEHPELLEKWRALSIDEEGNSLYYSPREMLLYYHSVFGENIRKKYDDRQESETLGFVSNYARTHVREDIAELCEEVENNPSRIADLLYGSKKNERIAAKLALAEEYRLIPQGFREYTDLGRLLVNSSHFRGVDSEGGKEFLRRSGEFIAQHPGSVYEAELRNKRSWVFTLVSNIDEDPEYTYTVDSYERDQQKRYMQALEESAAVLHLPYADAYAFTSALVRMEELYSLTLQSEKADACLRAVRLITPAYERDSPEVRQHVFNILIDVGVLSDGK